MFNWLCEVSSERTEYISLTPLKCLLLRLPDKLVESSLDVVWVWVPGAGTEGD